MYQAFEAIVSKGKIKPVEKIKLREATRVLVTIVDPGEYPGADWKRLKKWISRQRRSKKFTSHHSIDDAGQHLRTLLKK
ncbi:MAG: antitoxin family protein [Deltaproteobacteria bacterium]|nr:antitoxin family protein [Deltaproteobacteria bacterium]